jgi:hypothetical protein
MANTKQIKDLGPVCHDENRLGFIQRFGPEILNGINFVEYERRGTSLQTHVLVVHFINPLPDDPPVDPYGLTADFNLIHIIGGVRIINIKVTDVAKVSDHIEITVDKAGDFSIYWLAIGWKYKNNEWMHTVPQLDRQYSRIGFSFKASCPVDIDCKAKTYDQLLKRDEPIIDYMAKDYASFRKLLLDQVAQLNPDWLERNPADQGIALVELLAYTGDYLSYYQDAVANEAFLDTTRQRVSAKRHARLIDYNMHDGRNAWTFIHLAVEDEGKIPQGTLIITKIEKTFRDKSEPPETEIPEDDLKENPAIDLREVRLEDNPALLHSRIFETAFPIDVYQVNNEIYFHTWGNLECCLSTGLTNAHVYALDPDNPQKIIRPEISNGDYLLIEEVKNPVSRDKADVIDDTIVDPVYKDQLESNKLCPRENAAEAALPLLHITWCEEDSLTFPLCLSARPLNEEPILNISIARGNMVLADHGRTITEKLRFNEPVAAEEPFYLNLSHGPLTMHCPFPEDKDPCHRDISEKIIPRYSLNCHAREATPAITMDSNSLTEQKNSWVPVRDLLDSSEFDPHFVVDIDNNDFASLRFGDGTYGMEPAGIIEFTASYRIGNGKVGNVSAESLAHIVKLSDSSNWPAGIHIVRNPLAAKDGTDPETIEEVRQYAPAAFHAEQYRAVTESDYINAANKCPDVAGAAASFIWTGSWLTVFVGIDPVNPDNLITESGGRTRLDPAFKDKLLNYISGFRLAGYDLQIRSGDYVPLEIDLEICVSGDYFRDDVTEAVYQRLSNRISPTGQKGFFHWDNFTFGQPVYLSKLYAAIENVEGVVSVIATLFKRFGKLANKELENGLIPIGNWEIARLDNDPNNLENGTLRIIAKGGK